VEMHPVFFGWNQYRRLVALEDQRFGRHLHVRRRLKDQGNPHEASGKFHRRLKSPRIRGKDGIYEYVLAWRKETQIDRDIVLTEIDIENLIRAKGAESEAAAKAEAPEAAIRVPRGVFPPRATVRASPSRAINS
jgi:hypothetical protein